MTLGVELAIGVASGMLWDALKRPMDVVLTEFRRHNRIRRSLVSQQSRTHHKENDIIDKVLDDLTRIIGNNTGQLTSQVAMFVRDLRATAIPESISHSALSGISSEPLRAAFHIFHERYDDIPFTADQLFDALIEACNCRIGAVADPALLEIIRAQHSVLLTRVEAIAHSLSRGLNESENISPEQIRDARQRIAKSIQNEHRYVSIETLRGPKKVSLTSISIPGRLAELHSSHVAAAKMPQSMDTQSYIVFRRLFHRAVVVGDPGGGKSTLTQMLSSDLARLIITDSNSPMVRQIEERDLHMPLRIILRRYEASKAKIPSYSILDHLRDDLKAALDGDENLAKGYLSTALGTGEAMVIFDGLDEVLDVGARSQMVELIEQFAALYPASPILVTSRLVGYRDAPLNEDFSIYGLDRFNSTEIMKFATKSISAIGQIKVAEASKKAADFFNQSSHVGRDLRENPLMLGLMVQIYLNRGDVPSNRPEVYKECATLMFEKWDGRRQIVADVPRQEVELLDVFGYVASRTFGNASSEEGVTREWLIAELRSHFEDWYVDRASANRAANSLVAFLTGRAWVMSEVGLGTFKFTHRTFLEYFFARHLISESKSMDELIRSELIPKIIDNQWSVISDLALHMAVFRDGGKSRQAAETLEDVINNSAYPTVQELYLIRFIASTLSFLVIPEASFLRLVRQCISRAIKLGSTEELGAIGIIESIISYSGHRMNIVQLEVSRQIDECLANGLGPELLFAMYTLARGVRAKSTLRYVSPPISTVWDGSESVALKHKNNLRLLAETNAKLARAYIYLFNEDRAALFEKIGSSLLLSSESTLYPSELDSLVFDAVNIICRSRGRISGGETVSDAVLFINEISAAILRDDIHLYRLLKPGRSKNRQFNEMVGSSLSTIQYAIRMRESGIHLSRIQAECLVCVLDSIEPLDSGAADTIETRHMPPLSAIAGMVAGVQDSDILQWLNRWIKHSGIDQLNRTIRLRMRS